VQIKINYHWNKKLFQGNSRLAKILWMVEPVAGDETSRIVPRTRHHDAAAVDAVHEAS
jgi:hypothetical protein